MVNSKNLKILSKQEQKIVDIIRSKDNQKLYILIKGGVPIRLSSEEEIPIDDKNFINEFSTIIKEKEFQNINVSQKHGKPILLKREEIILLNDT